MALRLLSRSGDSESVYILGWAIRRKYEPWPPPGVGRAKPDKFLGKPFVQIAESELEFVLLANRVRATTTALFKRMMAMG